MKILQTADWHIDQQNIEFTVPAIEQAILSAPDYDLFIHAGDLAVHRGHIHPNVAWEVRRLIKLGHEKARLGGIVVAGNHDQSYIGENKGMVSGILDGFDNPDDSTMHLVESPRNITIEGITFVCVPTPTKVGLKLAQETENIDPSGLLENMVLGLIAEATGPKIAVYHGTVTGASLGNEMVMKAGMDVALPRSAFKGCEFVIAGHIHHKQVMGEGTDTSPQVFYCGAPAPLTWNDKLLKPAMFIHDGLLIHSEHPIPVISQMVELSHEATSEDDPSALSVFIGEESSSGDRVRVTVTAPSAYFDRLPPVVIGEYEKNLRLRQLKIIPDKTDDMAVRFDVDTDFTIPDAFDKWCELKGVDEADSKRRRSIIEQIEALIVDAHLDAHYECKPVSIKAHNWCQFEDFELIFDQLGKVTSIDGPNYGGKSNLSKAFLFSRYKSTGGRKLEAVIRNGEKKAWVEEVFERSGQRWKIRREIIRTTKSARAEFYLMKEVDGAWASANLGSAAETQTFLESLIGPLDLFLATGFAGQSAAGSLLGLSPSDMKDMLLSVMHRDFDGRLDLAKEMHKTAEAKIRSMEIKREALSHASGDLKQIRQSVDDNKALVLSGTLKLETVKGEIESTDELIKDKEIKIAAMESDAKRLEDLIDRRQDYDQQIDLINLKIEKGEEARGQSRMFHMELDAMNIEQGETVANALTDAREAHTAIIESNQRFNDSIADLTSKRVDELEPLKTKTAALARDLENSFIAVKAAKKAAELVDGVPCSGRTWTDQTPDSVGRHYEADMSACQFLKNAITAKENIGSMEGDLQTVKTGFTAADERLKKQESEFNREQAEFQAKRESNVQKARDASAAMGICQLAYDDQQEARSEAVELREKIGALQGAVDAGVEAGDNLEPVEINKTAVVAKISELMKQLENRGEIERRIKELNALNDGYRQSVASITLSVDANKADIARAQGQIIEMEKAETQINEITEQVQNAAQGLADLSFVVDSLHRSGIPFLLLEQFAIPSLQENTNRYLQNTDIRIEIRSEKELTSGAARNEIVIMFTDHRGLHDSRAASGAQEYVIETALRNAQADLHAQFTGSRIWLTIADEGLGALDQKHIDGAKATIRQIAERRGWFIFISHVPGMAEIADTNITVVDNDGVSSLEIA